MEKVEINNTHIMVLRKNDNTGELESDYLPLQFQDQDKLKSIENLSNLKDVTVRNLYDAVIDKGLRYLLDGYNFCECLDGTYQQCLPITSNNIRNGYYSKSGLVRELRNRAIAYCLNERYKKCKQDPDIVAFSTRLIGWSCMHFSFNEDLSISYNTNFGYGWANYFTSNLKYRDVDILPYSMWVHYFNCGISQIMRYTRVYSIANSEWEKALEFGKEVYNSLVKDPEGFVNKWLVDEVKKMVDGLRFIFNNHDKVLAVNDSNNSKIELKTKESIVMYKGEKMSGALSFIDKIKAIETLNVSMDYHIESILDMNRQMLPELQQMKKEYQKALEDLNLEHDALLLAIAPYKQFVDEHLTECAENFIGGADYFAVREAKSIMEQLSPTFMIKAERLDELEDQEYNLSSKISHTRSVINTLTGYIETIEEAIKVKYETVA